MSAPWLGFWSSRIWSRRPRVPPLSQIPAGPRPGDARDPPVSFFFFFLSYKPLPPCLSPSASSSPCLSIRGGGQPAASTASQAQAAEGRVRRRRWPRRQLLSLQSVSLSLSSCPSPPSPLRFVFGGEQPGSRTVDAGLGSCWWRCDGRTRGVPRHLRLCCLLLTCTGTVDAEDTTASYLLGWRFRRADGPKRASCHGRPFFEPKVRGHRVSRSKRGARYQPVLCGLSYYGDDWPANWLGQCTRNDEIAHLFESSSSSELLVCCLGRQV